MTDPCYIIGNWKSNKTVAEATEWFDMFYSFFHSTNIKAADNREVIMLLCVPYTLLAICKDLIQQYQLPITLSAQSISSFDLGAYTGEIAGKMIKEHAEYVLIGHSERRRYLHETDDDCHLKAKKAGEASLSVIYCVGDETIPVPESVHLVAFEPQSAIGSGNPLDTQSAEQMCGAINRKTGKPVLYGGSVTDQTVVSFLQEPHIRGVLVGSASLKADEFFRIIKVASSSGFITQKLYAWLRKKNWSWDIASCF